MKTLFGRQTADFKWPLIWGIGTLLSASLFYYFVDLKPKVEENFFFSSDDPQFQADKNISKLFPQPPQLIMSAKGDIHSDIYRAKMEGLTRELLALPEVVEVQSLTRGPGDIKKALESPLWKRALISADESSTLISVMIKNVPPEGVI